MLLLVILKVFINETILIGAKTFLELNRTESIRKLECALIALLVPAILVFYF